MERIYITAVFTVVLYCLFGWMYGAIVLPLAYEVYAEVRNV